MPTFQNFPETHRGQPVRLILPRGYKLSTVGDTPQGGVVFGFVCAEDFVASKFKTAEEEAKIPSPSKSEESPSENTSVKVFPGSDSSPELSISPPQEFDSLSSYSPFDPQEPANFHSSSSPKVCPIHNIKGRSLPPSSKTSQTTTYKKSSIKKMIDQYYGTRWSSFMKKAATTRLSSIGNSVISTAKEHSPIIFLAGMAILVRVPYLLI